MTLIHNDFLYRNIFYKRIDNKGKKTPVTDEKTIQSMIELLPGESMRTMRANRNQKLHTVKRKFKELLSTGSTTMETQPNTKVKLNLSSVDIIQNEKVVYSYNYIKQLLPDQVIIAGLVDSLFPIEYAHNNNDSNTMGNIYFIRIRGTNMVKIGYTTQNVKGRLSQLQVSNPTQLDVEFLFSTPDFCRIEHQLHMLMAKQRIRGEWFYIKLGFDYESLIKQV